MKIIMRWAFAALFTTLGSTGWGQTNTFNKFAPATGVLKGSSTSYVTTAAASSDIRGLWSGTCDATTFLRGDGSCAATSVSYPLTLPAQAIPSAPASGNVLAFGYAPETNTITKLATLDNFGGLVSLGYEQRLVVYNTSGGTIASGQLVYANGSHSGTPTIALAQANSLTTLPAVGFTQYSIPNNSYGEVHVSGLVNTTTTGFTVGNPLYVSPTTPGAYTNVAPTAFGQYVQPIGVATTIAGAGAGQVQLDIQTPLQAVRGPTTGGTGLSSYTTGDILYGSATNVLATLAGNSTATKKYLTQTGTGTVSAAPAWNTIASADVISGWTGTCSSTTFLRGDGSCQTPAGGGSPGGSNTQIQYNNSGAFAGDSGLTYTVGSKLLTVGGTITLSNVSGGDIKSTDGTTTLSMGIGSFGLTGSAVIGVNGLNSINFVTNNLGRAAITSGMTLGAVADQGAGTINVSGNYYVNGTAVTTCTSSTWSNTPSGFSSVSSQTLKYTKCGNLVTVIVPSFTGTSNSTSFFFTGLPAAIQPASAVTGHCGGFEDNGILFLEGTVVPSGASIGFNLWATTGTHIQESSIGWTSTGTKGLNQGCSFTYSVQ